MFGNNKIMPPQKGDGSTLKIQEIFATFQGEGPYVGHPSIFVRLGGCNLKCDFCDTEFDSYKEISIDDIIKKVENLSRNNDGKTFANLVVITGGEPFIQPIEKLCDELIEKKFIVQIETNATFYRPINNKVKIVCSPKISNNKYHPIREDLLKRIDAIKFIISSSRKNYNEIADVGQSKYDIPVYLQPMDEYDDKKNSDNIKLVLNLAKKYGAIISLQTHKILNIK